jgi:ParB-like nuclease family protein
VIFKKNKSANPQDAVQTLQSAELGYLLFGQLHWLHQDYFDSLVGGHNRVELRYLPHYTFWRDGEWERPSQSEYYKYLDQSWKYYQKDRNTPKDKKQKIEAFIALKKDIESSGVLEPLPILVAPDGRKILLDGNHRASIAYFLGLDVPCRYVDTNKSLLSIVNNNDEFYGTQNKGVPYQSIFYKDREVLAGRRRDIFERFQKIAIADDIRGKDVLDIGSNIAMSAMLAWYFGAKSATGMEYSPKIASAALRISTVLDSRLTMMVQDLGVAANTKKRYDTVFCFSLHAHVKDKKMLEKNIQALTAQTLYFEGHEGSSRADYEHILRHFKAVEQIGFNQDGIHKPGSSTRPFFRCRK